MWGSFIAHLDATQLFTNLIVALVSAFLGGKLGVRRALEQARKERAFDRALQWHESTLRATSKFRHLRMQFQKELRDKDTFLATPERITELAKELGKCALELREAVFEAVLFAEKKAVNQLRWTAFELDAVSKRARDATEQPGPDTEFELLDELKPLDDPISEIHVALVRSIRNQLGLDKLSLSDLGFGPEPARSEKIRGFVLARAPFVAKLFPRMFPQ